jgi:uncharacterized protein
MTHACPNLFRAAALLLCLASLGGAADQGSITVSGTGEVLAKPNCLEIDLRAAAAAEITSDAVVKYQDALRRIQDSLTKLGMKELKIEERDLRITSGDDDSSGMAGIVFAQRQQAAAPKATVRIARSLRLTVSDIDKLSESDLVAMISKLVDTAKDAGATVGKAAGSNMFERIRGQQGDATALVRFLVEHPEELREEAYRKAFAEATTRAQRLARLAGARLGKAISIDETETMSPVRMTAVAYGISTTDDDESRLSSDKLIDIPIRVSLRVQFALDDSSPENAKPEKGSDHATR